MSISFFFNKSNIFLRTSKEINNPVNRKKGMFTQFLQEKQKKLARCKKNIIHKYIHTTNKGIIKNNRKKVFLKIYKCTMGQRQG